MSDVVIRAEGLGKRYLIGHQSAERERYTALRDVVARAFKGLGRSALDMVRGRQIVGGDEVEEFWALKDVSFEIKRGEVVGVIGRNGAGKSTLLKILSRITEPSRGRVEIRGRVASLLEVGTGFHPELTGRENIYLNGAILGMTRAEIRRKFDEIVDFADVEKFLDTPVKRYSSGMYVRLAFAVAAHLEPEILVVDEVLAVGDAEFQKKCLGKIQHVAGQGRTVLFVSHNMGATRALCSSGLLFSKGRLLMADTIGAIIDEYSKAQLQAQRGDHGRESARIRTWEVQLGEDPKILLVVDGISVQEDLYEIRAFISSVSGEAIGIASCGGFGAAGIHLNGRTQSASLDIQLSRLAAGVYNVNIEFIQHKNGQTAFAPLHHQFEFSPGANAGEMQYLQSKWGIGFMRFPMLLAVTGDNANEN